MSIQVLIQQSGPLPIKEVFNAPSNAPIYLEVNGSVWSESVNAIIGISVELDGEVLGQAQIFSSGDATHQAVVPAYFELTLEEGRHSIVLTNYRGASDGNDFFTAALHY